MKIHLKTQKYKEIAKCIFEAWVSSRKREYSDYSYGNHLIKETLYLFCCEDP